MNVVELHYKAFPTKYIIIGRITEIPNGGGCSFFTETKASPSKTYYNIVTNYGVSDPNIYIKEAEGGIRTSTHPILCLVKYDGSWCIALPPTNSINNFDVCDPNYSCGTNAGLAYPFINWFNQGLEVTWDDLEDEVNPTYTNLRENEQQGNKAVRYPILPYLGSIQISPIGSIVKDYLVLGVSVPDSWNYMKMTIEVLPYTTNVSGVFETYTILSKKDSINGVTTERKIDVIRDTVGEKANSSQGINFCTYGNYIFILMKSQMCYSISNFASVNNNCSMRLMSQRQACSIANNTLAEGDTKYTVANSGANAKWFFPNSLSPSRAVTLRYNTPRLIKQYGTTTERNNLINGMNNDDVTLSGNTVANKYFSYVRGVRYFDTTLKKPLYLTSTKSDGADGWYWVDANGNDPDIPTKGTTQQRPVSGVSEGFEFYDTTLKKKYVYNGNDDWATFYEKSDSGIPKTDLASDVQASLALADTAIQSHQDISGKEDKLPIAVYSASTSSIQLEMAYNRIDFAVGTMTFTLPTVTSSDHLQGLIVSFTTDTTPAITVSASDAIVYAEGSNISQVQAGTPYEMNAIYDGIKWKITLTKFVIPS